MIEYENNVSDKYIYLFKLTLITINVYLCRNNDNKQCAMWR